MIARRMLLLALAAGLVAACTDDGPPNRATTTTAGPAPGTTAAPDTTAAPGTTAAPATTAAAESTAPETTASETTASETTVSDTTEPGSTAPGSTAPGGEGAASVAEPELREELLAMMAEDQAEITGQVATNNYRQRTDRLAEILDEYGWPGHDLVGEDGSTAAWVIAQHADLDPQIQQRALELLRAAAGEGQASPGDLAYLEDRVAVGNGDQQRYGTQIRCDANRAVPATPIADRAGVDDRRAAAGLPPLADYFAEMDEVCSAAPE